MTSEIVESSPGSVSSVIDGGEADGPTPVPSQRSQAVVVQGVGARGPVGPPGPMADPPYLHEQAVESVEWIVNHNKGRAVAVTVFTVSGAEATAEVAPASPNQVRVRHATPQRGSALVL